MWEINYQVTTPVLTQEFVIITELWYKDDFFNLKEVSRCSCSYGREGVRKGEKKEMYVLEGRFSSETESSL